ncbi:MAG: NAD(P)-dependent alcohol dehydrogenase [Aeromicrobium sp.]
MKVQAAVLREADKPFLVEQLDLEDPRDDEVLVRIVAAGLCHTDLLSREAPDMFFQGPFVAGHEGAGVVEAVGAGVNDLAPGDHVVLSFASCGECVPCKDDHPAYCLMFAEHNFAKLRLADGSTALRDAEDMPVGSHFFGQSSFASHAVVGKRSIVKVDKSYDLITAGPLGCGIQTGAGAVLNSFDLQDGETIVIAGAGSVGLAAVMAAKYAGASEIIVVDLHQTRLDLATKYGATTTVKGDPSGLSSAVREVAPTGVDYALDTTGNAGIVRGLHDSLGPFGILGICGVGFGDVALDMTALLSGRKIIGIIEGDAVPQSFIPRLLKLNSDGLFPFDELVTPFPISDINTAEAMTRSGETVKPVLTF